MPVRTEDSFQKSFSPAVGSGAQTQIIRLCIKCFYPLHSVAPLLHVFGRRSFTEPGAGPRGPLVSHSTQGWDYRYALLFYVSSVGLKDGFHACLAGILV